MTYYLLFQPFAAVWFFLNVLMYPWPVSYHFSVFVKKHPQKIEWGQGKGTVVSIFSLMDDQAIKW